jgi:hypothetical protein
MRYAFYAQSQAVEHIHEFTGVRTKIFHPQLRRFKFRRGNHIHCPRNLLGLLNGTYFSFDILERGHYDILLN